MSACAICTWLGSPRGAQPRLGSASSGALMSIPLHFASSPGLLQGRAILITGASGGFGRALALECARAGATVILSGRSCAKIERLYDEIEALGAPQPAMAVLDLATATAVDYDGLANTIEREFGKLDGWCMQRRSWESVPRWSSTTYP